MQKTISILLVDDFEPMRRLIHLMVKERSWYKIAGEATDGPEAVRNAKELRPDIILMDLSLPTSNGFDVAKVILRDAPDSRIIFVTENNRAEIAREAFRVGASAYVLKSRAGRELMTAIESVLDGHPFVSAGLTE